MFDDFKEGDKAKITFQNCSIFSLNNCNDEGYYYGQYRTNPSEFPWGGFYEVRSGLDRKLPEPTTIISKGKEGKRHYIFFFKDETFECLADDFKLELLDKKGNRKRLSFSYKLRPAYNSNEQLIEFVKIGDACKFIEKLLDLLSKNGFSFDDITDVWMYDEIWIHLKSSNGKTTITKDIWDMIFILGEENQTDINKIDQVLMDSGEFEKNETNPEDYET